MKKLIIMTCLCLSTLGMSANSVQAPLHTPVLSTAVADEEEELTVAQQYEQTYSHAKEVYEEWKDFPNMYSRKEFNLLKSLLITYAPEKVTDETKMKTAISLLGSRTEKVEQIGQTLINTKTSIINVADGVDPNFHIYLCFGQSNMQGIAPIEQVDREYVDPRFVMMAAVDMTGKKRTICNWYTAFPPLCREDTQLTPCDYFGRDLVANLPDSIKVGVINVAVGGASIRLFDQGLCASEIAGSEDWFKNWCKPYENDPYKRLVECAKWAQKAGVIKGILLHQGCTDEGKTDWPARVKRVYTRLLNDLSLNEAETPLIAGEVLQEDMGGSCWRHNSIINRITDAVPNAYVVSSANCPAQDDALHFTSEGARMMGHRYADIMLRIYGQTKQIDFDYSDGYFPLTENAFRSSIYRQGSCEVTSEGITQKGTNSGNICGWRFSKGIDLSSSKYLVVKLSEPATCNPVFRIWDTDDCLNPCFMEEMGDKQTLCVDLQTITKANGETLDLSHICLVGFSTNASSELKISKVFLSDDGETPASTDISSIDATDLRNSANDIYYDLSGRQVSNPSKGIYIKNNKKVFVSGK